MSGFLYISKSLVIFPVSSVSNSLFLTEPTAITSGIAAGYISFPNMSILYAFPSSSPLPVAETTIIPASIAICVASCSAKFPLVDDEPGCVPKLIFIISTFCSIA